MILIDSAKEEDVRKAMGLGWVHGVTTNPTLLAQAGVPPVEALQRLAALEMRPIFYQLTCDNEEDMLAEAQKALEIVRYELVLKIAPTRAGFQFIARHNQEFRCALTALYSPAQAMVAAECGAIYAITYVNRATRLMGNGLSIVAGMAAVLKDSHTEVLVASIKSAEEAADSVRAGAQHLTVPYDILLAMMENPYSNDAVKQFNETGVGIA